MVTMREYGDKRMVTMREYGDKRMVTMGSTEIKEWLPCV